MMRTVRALFVHLVLLILCSTSHAGEDPLWADGFECRLWYADTDNDGYGDPAVSVLTCTPDPGFVVNNQDCDDTSPYANLVFANDPPDAAFFDANCDGIDGEINNAIFVSNTLGADGPSCGAINNTCATIQFAMIRAATAAKPNVYVATGNYPETVTLGNGINLYGGFALNFERNPDDAIGSRVVTVLGSPATPLFGDNQGVTLIADALTLPIEVADLVLRGPTVTAQLAGGQGKSSYTVIARNIGAGVLTLRRNEIRGGIGADGVDGSNGSSADPLTPTNGMRGGNGVAGNESSVVTGGLGGVNTCVGGSATTGGTGGDGGDTNGNFSPGGPGQNGGSGAQATGAFGGGGSAGPAGGSGQGGNGGPGEPGRVTHGTGGLAGQADGFLINQFWYAFSGTAGGVGDNGGGAGAGGGGGSSDANVDDYGGSGGGGGAGGCRAPVAGTGGKGGGSAFNVYLINAQIVLEDNSFMLGTGGRGGAGGAGGNGQAGGLGGNPSPAFESSGLGGEGGIGGVGGHSGGGGGGATGNVVAVFMTSAMSSFSNIGNQFSGGAMQAGGSGGISAGNSGQDGADGAVMLHFTCAAAANC